jgi:hypothetical protein
MIRQAAGAIVALLLYPAVAHSQDVVLTVSVPAADVYKGPSTATPVIGHASRGTVLPVSRNLGSWVKVRWPEAADGVGYVHVTMGRVGPPAATPVSADATPAATPSAAPAAQAPATASPVTRTSASQRLAPPASLPVPPASHAFGVGGLIGSPNAFGATARAWTNNHFGIQLGLTRESMTSDAATGRVTATQFEPGVVYGLFDHVSDYVWIRPYVGSVVSFGSQSLNIAAPIVIEPASQSYVGFRAFGGSEFMFASMPRFGVSADLGYRRLPIAFPGFDSNPLSLSIAGHWYVK